jgi:hypothetical protein
MQSLLGDHFVAMAHMEAASVPAFAAIERELQSYGATPELIAAARRARLDEISHAHEAARLAARYGSRAVAPVVKPMPLRDLRAFALDNAVEGCVYETYAALEAGHQALHASHAEIRETMRRIAADETRHALLSWQIARWVAPQLSASVRASIRDRQLEAVAKLARRLSSSPDPELCAVAGVPDAATATALHASLVAELWA